MTQILSDDLLRLVAARTVSCDVKVWGFGVGPALVGMLRAGSALDDDGLISHVDALVRPALDNPPDPTDHLIAVEALVELAELRPGARVRPAIARFAHAVLEAERPMPGRPPVHRPDLPALSRTIWVDCLHTDGPGLLTAGYPDQAAAVVEEASAALQSESGLYSHAFDVAAGRANGVHWGRGQGWALHGLVQGAMNAGLESRLDALLSALERFEVHGRWRTIVDDPVAPFEASVSAIVASGVLLGATAGVVSHDRLPLARRALAAAVEDLDHDGGLVVSEATPAGPPAGYLTRASGVYPWGQGPMLLALIEGRKHL